MFLNAILDIVQYEAELILPEDFYEYKKRTPSLDSSEQPKIDELILAVCQNMYMLIHHKALILFTCKLT